MKRTLLENLLTWKDRPTRKPLLIDGARQTAKTFRLQELLGSTFGKCHKNRFPRKPQRGFQKQYLFKVSS
ncbi:hypothetical protein FORC22_0351 [Vibrio parahaemolyticus]|nr:hypothetical protein FORC22_0351 [Vibrio parahaemolyticus]